MSAHLAPPPASAAGVDERVRLVLRPVGSGLPLGLFAFGIGMAVLGADDAALVPASVGHQVGWLLITFVAPAQLLAAVLAFAARDTATATGMGLFAVNWATIGTQFQLGPPGAPSPALGLYLVAFSSAVLLLGAATLTGQPLIGATMLLAVARGGLAASYEFGGDRTPLVAAGCVGMAITVIAFYTALALVLEDTASHTVLPLARQRRSRTALSGQLADQTADLPTEAGVRRSL